MAKTVKGLTADVVVVGAGVVGASVAYHLTAAGTGSVLVVERADRPGQGSTAGATGGFRAQFDTEVNVRLSLLARERLLAFEQETGVDPGFIAAGYLYLARDEAGLEALRAGMAVQRAAGVAGVRELDRSEVAAVNPHIRVDDVVGARFCPTDGFMRPASICEGYAAAAARAGVRFRYGVEATRLLTDAAGRVSGVRLGEQVVSTRCVVNAAGAWAAALGRELGIEVPVAPLRRQVAATEPFDGLPREMPMTVDTWCGFHFRVRDDRVLLVLPGERPVGGDDPFGLDFDEAWLAPVWERGRHRAPALARTRIDRAACWSCLYEVSPDHHALLGPVPGVEGLVLANGHSGHGVMHAPATGRLVAEIVTEGAARSADVRALRPERFAEGEPNPSGGYI